MLTAQQIPLVAVPWLVLTKTGSPAATALVSAVQVTPILVAKLFAGPLLDRVRAARISVTGDLICAAGMLLVAAGSPPLWLIVAVMTAVGAAQGPSAAAKAAVLAEVTRVVLRPTQWRTGLIATVERCATTLGPALAGLLIAVVGGNAGHEQRMVALGHRVTALYATGYPLASAIAGAGGALLVTVNRYISPGDIGFEAASLVLLAAAIGAGTMTGALAGAVAVVVARDLLGASTDGLAPLLLGLLFLVVVYGRPAQAAVIRRRRTARTERTVHGGAA